MPRPNNISNVANLDGKQYKNTIDALGAFNRVVPAKIGLGSNGAHGNQP